MFYGINCYDKVLMHNPLSPRALPAKWATTHPKTRYCEVYLKDDLGTAGPITSSDYYGLYVLEEKIKIGKNRVDIDKLQPENTTCAQRHGRLLAEHRQIQPRWSAITCAEAADLVPGPRLLRDHLPSRTTAIHQQLFQ